MKTDRRTSGGLRTRRRIRRVAFGAFASAASGTLLLSLVGASSAAADSSSTTTTTAASSTSSPSSSSSSPSSSSSSSGSTLGGFQVSSTGAGITWSYEQPNFPVPATPTMEANLGYSTSSYDAGPTGESLASVFWPGSVAAGAPKQLGLLLQPYFGNTANDLPAPPWPVQAASSYPPGPGSSSQANQDGPGVTMESSSTQSAGTATSGFDTSYLRASGFVSVQQMESAVQSTVVNGQAVAQATSAVHGVSIAGGLITIGQVTSTATSTSDGNQAQVAGTSTVSQVSVGGQPATLDASGLHVLTSSLPVPSSLLSNVQQQLQAAGISITLTNPTDTVSGASGQRQLDGVKIQIDLTSLDKNANKLVASLPQSLQQKVIDQLPLPIPDTQIITIDLGWANVAASASPGYNAGLSSGSSADLGGPGSAGAAGLGTAGDSGLGGSFGSSGTGLTGGSGTGGSGGSGPASTAGFSPATAAAPAKLFEGIGTGLIALGLILGLLLGAVLWRADRAVGALTAAVPCVGEQPANF